MIIHESPDDAVRAKGKLLASIRKEKGQQAFDLACKQLCLTDLWFLIRYALDWGWLDEDLHGREMLSFLFNKEEEDKAVFIPRGHIKTMSMCAVRIQQILRNPNIAILAASATEGLAQGIANLITQELRYNLVLQRLFPEILPNKENVPEQWGKKDGYSLPGRKPRIDPTLYVGSINTTVTGRHPDIIWLDDLITPENNNPTGWMEAEEFLKTCLALIPPHGWIDITGTRYHDSDPYGKIIGGEILGNKGTFRTLVKGVYTPDGELIYPEAIRWNMSTPSGFTKEGLAIKKKSMKSFFNAQYLNDPAPEEDQEIRADEINRYLPEDLPELTNPIFCGVEITGGGRLIYQILQEESDKLKLGIPLMEMINKRKQGETKHDKIIATLQPYVTQGKVFAQDWMLGEIGKPAPEGTLGYEISRLRAAKNDDIADVVHNMFVNLIKTHPREGKPADLYIGVDLAFTEEKRSDWSVVAAIAVDSKDQRWIVDYERFQVASPSGIVQRIITFYRKWCRQDSNLSIQRRPSFAARY